MSMALRGSVARGVMAIWAMLALLALPARVAAFPRRFRTGLAFPGLKDRAKSGVNGRAFDRPEGQQAPF